MATIAKDVQIKTTNLGISLTYTDHILNDTPHTGPKVLHERPRAWALYSIIGLSLEATWVSLKMANGMNVSVNAKDKAGATELYHLILGCM